jgi:hypothetical protein
MELYLFSAFGLPSMAIAFFTLLRAISPNVGIWEILSGAGLDLCRVSIGVVGAIFLDVQVRKAEGTFAVFILLLNLMFTGAAMVVETRATDMGIRRESIRAFGILGIGICSMVVPAILIVLIGGK